MALLLKATAPFIPASPIFKKDNGLLLSSNNIHTKTTHLFTTPTGRYTTVTCVFIQYRDPLPTANAPI
jgi:hypothetical protein